MDRYPLSPVDHLFLGPGSQPITFAFRFGNALDPERLREALHRTTEYFPLLQCRIGRSTDGSYEFQRADEPHTLEVRASDLPFDPASGTSPYIEPVRSVEDAPLARFVLTRTPSGTVLAASLSHALVDGFSYFHFLSSWARICRNERPFPPSLDRSFFAEVRTGAGTGASEIDLTRDCGLFTGEQRSDRAATMPPERYSISARGLAAICEEARQVAGVALTENDIIVAHIWKNLVAHTPSSPPAGSGSGSWFVTCPVDFRRLLPGFAKTYFGCALVFATACIRADGRAGAGTGLPPDIAVGHLAVLVKEAIARMKGERIMESLRALETFRLASGPAGMERVHLRHPDRGIIVTNLTRMPVGDIDFGSGPPQDLVPFVGVSGGAAILPSDDGISIITSR